MGFARSESFDSIQSLIDYSDDKQAAVDLNRVIDAYKDTDMTDQGEKDRLLKEFHFAHGEKYRLEIGATEEDYFWVLRCAKTNDELEGIKRGTRISFNEAKKFKEEFSSTQPTEKTLSYHPTRFTLFSHENRCKTMLYASLALGAVAAAVSTYVIKKCRVIVSVVR